MKLIRAVGMAFLGGLFFAAGQAAQCAAPARQIDGQEIELARYAKAFIGSGNVTVEVAPYKRGSKDGAILLFRGIEGDWDGKALNHQVKPASNGGQDYVTSYQGKPWTTLVVRRSGATKFNYELFIPGLNEPTLLTPSDGAAQSVTPEKIYEQYRP